MTDDLRALLTDVAEGRIAPAQAAVLIDDLPPTADERPATTATTAPTATTAATATPAAPAAEVPAETAVDLIRITSSARPVRIVGDPSVATVTVDGPHLVRREGGTIRVDATPMAGSLDTATPAGSYRYERKNGLSRWLGQNTWVGVPVTVRVNPHLAIEAEVMAGSLEILAMHGDVTFSATAGSVRATDCTGSINGSVRIGSARLDVRPTAGRSSVRVESGSVDLRLQPGSDVRVTGRTDLGEIKVKSSDGTTHVTHGEGLQDLVVGAGTALFELEVAMGSVKVRLP